MGYHKSESRQGGGRPALCRTEAAGIDVLLDDRNERPGVMFADMELIGIPHRVVIGERGLKEGKLEYKGRTDAEPTMIAAGRKSSHASRTNYAPTDRHPAAAGRLRRIAGAQKYEPLSASVQAALHKAVSDQHRPPSTSFSTPMEAIDWLAEMSRAPGKADPQPGIPPGPAAQQCTTKPSAPDSTRNWCSA